MWAIKHMESSGLISYADVYLLRMRGKFRFRERCRAVSLNTWNIFFTTFRRAKHPNASRADAATATVGGGSLEIVMRTYLFLSDSCRKNSVGVNERQLVLIKNEIAPLHAMELYQNKIMINFCVYKTLLWAAEVPKQQRYNCSEAGEEEKHSFRGSAGCSYSVAHNKLCGCSGICAYTSAAVGMCTQSMFAWEAPAQVELFVIILPPFKTCLLLFLIVYYEYIYFFVPEG